MNKRTFLGLGISLPLVLIAVYLLNMPLPAPQVDQRAHPLATKLAEAFPELKNRGEGSDRPSVSWDVADIDAKPVAAFRISNVSSKERQDQIFKYLEAAIAAESIARIELVFYWKDAAQARQSRKEQIEKKS